MKTVTTQPLGLILAPNQLGQYPDGAASACTGIVFRGAGSCQSAPSFDVVYSIDCGEQPTAAEIIPTDGYTLVLVKLAAGWRYCWVDDTNTASALTAAVTAYNSNCSFEVDGRVDWCIIRDRILVTSDSGPLIFDYLSPTTDAERAPRIAGMFAPALSVALTTGTGKSAIKSGQQCHVVACVVRHFDDCYEIIGAPSAAVQAFAASSDANLEFTVYQRPGHPQILVGDSIEVYRTIQVRGPVNDGTPAEYDQGISNEPNYYLCAVYAVTTDASSYTFESGTGDQNLGTALYTNIGASGSTSQKRPPPIARVIEEYRGYAFYFDTTEAVARVTRTGAGIGQQTDDYSTNWGIGGADTVEAAGTSWSIANADILARMTSCNVDCINRVNPDTPGVYTTPGTSGFAFRFDYAAAGNLTLRATHGDRYLPTLPTPPDAAEVNEPTYRANGLAWSESGQPEDVTSAGIVSTRQVFGAQALSQSMIMFTDTGLFRLSGSGGTSSAGFDWAQEHIDTQSVLRGPKAYARMGDYVYACTNNGAVAVDLSGQIQEISTSALGKTLSGPKYLSTDNTRVVADFTYGDIYFALDRYAYVYSTRWNKWSRVEVAPSDVLCANSTQAAGMLWVNATATGLDVRAPNESSYQASVHRFQPTFFGSPQVNKLFQEIEWLFAGSAAGSDVKLLANKLEGVTRTLKQLDETTLTYVQAAVASNVQGDTDTFAMAQTAMQVPRNAPCVSNGISIGYFTEAGTQKFEFFGCVITAEQHETTRRQRS